VSDHSINDLDQSISRVDDVRVRQPVVELLSLHQDFPFDPVVGQWTKTIYEAIPQPSDRARRVGRQCLEVEVPWLDQITLHHNPLSRLLNRLSSGA
jgi:hypothetical protein